MNQQSDRLVTNAGELIDAEASAAVVDAIEAGVDAAQPATVIREQLAVTDGVLQVGDERYDLTAHDEVVVLGGGNAAGHVARALEDVLGTWLDRGTVVTDDPAETSVIEVRRGSHPTPDERAAAATRAIREQAREAGERTLAVVVVTGGGSALLPAPAGDVALSDLQELTDELLRSGAPIAEINAVRKHVSAVKGGQLARTLAPATTVGLAFSDVATDDPAVVASGPISPDPTTYEAAKRVLRERDVETPRSVEEHIEAGVDGEVEETPTRDASFFENVTVHVLANGFTALDAAAAVCEDAGYDPLVLSASVRGEAREAAKTHVAIAEEIRATGNPIEPPAAVLSGGETTVTVRGDGTGGPNQEFALAAALELPEGVVLASVDTDGIDGASEAAGALVRPETAGDTAAATAARSALDANDAFPFLAERGCLVYTGPTGTNVNDLRIAVVTDE